MITTKTRVWRLWHEDTSHVEPFGEDPLSRGQREGPAPLPHKRRQIERHFSPAFPFMLQALSAIVEVAHVDAPAMGKHLLHFLGYAAISVPVVLGAFVAGVVFERQRLQNWSVEQLPATLPVGGLGTASKAEQDPAPYQVGTAPKEQQDWGTRGNQAAQERIDKSMRAIEAAWRAAIEAEDLLAVKIGSCYGARLIRRGANVRADLAKIDGVAVVGVIRITGMTAGNQPAAKDSCYASVAHALNASKRTFEPLDHVEAKLTYRIKNADIQLDSVESEPGWLAIAINDNVRLSLGSWRAVSIQRLDPE